MAPPVPFEGLETTDLRVGEVYEGGSQDHVGADPISRLVRVGNMGGIRASGERGAPNFRVALFTTEAEVEWPDQVDPGTAVLTYFGDNRQVGRELRVPRGNRVLEQAFLDQADGGAASRAMTPPFFVFAKGGTGRDVRFLGLAAMGVDDDEDDLVGVWRRGREGWFLNYQARFTILDAPLVERSGLRGLISGEGNGDAPLAWSLWRDRGVRLPLGRHWFSSEV